MKLYRKSAPRAIFPEQPIVWFEKSARSLWPIGLLDQLEIKPDSNEQRLMRSKVSSTGTKPRPDFDWSKLIRARDFIVTTGN